MKIFVSGASKLLTDHHAHGEGLITWKLISGLADRGQEIVACARDVDLRGTAPFRTLALGGTLPSKALDPVGHALRTARLIRKSPHLSDVDVVHWVRPIDPFFVYPRAHLAHLPKDLPLVVGPIALPWPEGVHASGVRTGERVLEAAAAVIENFSSVRSGAARVIPLATTADVVNGLPTAWQSNCRVLPIGVDAAQFRPTVLPAVPTALFSGSLTARKGIREAIEAFSRARERVGEARLILAGDGPERAWIEARIRELRMEGAVEMLGSVSHETMPALLERSTVLLSASHGEPYGMAVLEAMAAGRAVVAVREGGPKAHVEDGKGGFLVARADVSELAASLVRVFNDATMAEAMGRFNRQRVESSLSLEVTLTRLMETYEDARSLVASRPSRETRRPCSR